MEENKIKQIVAGVSIMASVFLLMIVVQNFSKKGTSIATDTFPYLSTSIRGFINGEKSTLRGSFNVSSRGDVVYNDIINKNKEFHYKGIFSEKLKNQSAKPKLRLEAMEKGQKVWKDTSWSWIDYSQGILYFYYKTVENGIELPADNYTGEYQLNF